MKRIAVACENEKGDISMRAGRATLYLVFDEKAKVVEKLKNPFRFGSGGAGFAVAKMLADKKIDIVIAGNFGGNMEMAMEERGLKHFVMEGNAVKAVNEVNKKH